MVAELSTLTLADLGRIVTGKTPPTSIAKNFGGDIPFITPSDMDGRRIIGETARYLTETGANSVKGARIPKGTIMVSCIGSDMGKTAIAAHDSVTNQQINSIIVDDRFCTKFVYYNLSTRKHEIRHQAAGGSAQPILNKSGFSKLPILLPPLPEQKAIARILGTLDDKIELNRRMNATLEAMARALFQSWFVDFDPVHAKAASPSGLSDEALAKLGMDAATAALFPSAFQASELGDIPKGWTAGTFGDVATNPRRFVQPNEIAPNTSYIALEHMPRRSIALGDWEPSAEVESGKTAFQKGEILFGKLRPYFHKVGVAPVSGVCSTDILVLAPTKPDWFGFLLGHASSDAAVHFADKHSTGTKMPRTNWTDLSSFKMALPHPSIAKAFNDQIQPIIGRIQPNLHQSRTLATLRDTLLPKLLSGELSVASTSMKASA